MSNYLIHYGVPGQKHGNRRYQNEDGSLTPEGKIHYGVGQGRKNFNSFQKKPHKSKSSSYRKGSYKKYNNIKSVGKKSLNSTVNKDKSFIDKANDFLGSPIGRTVTGLGISVITGVTTALVKEMLFADIGFRSAANNPGSSYGASDLILSKYK